MALSEDLRLRVVKMVEGGASCRAAGRHFDVSARTAVRIVDNFKARGHVADKPRGKRGRRLDPYREEIHAWVEATPDMTLQEISDRLGVVHEIHAPVATVDDWLKAEGLSFKITAHAAERERADVHKARTVLRYRSEMLNYL